MEIVVGISDMKVSNNPDDVIISYSLGSCIGVIIWDPEVKAGGLLHYLLPDSNLDKEKAKKNPFMFSDSGVPLLFREAYKFGANKKRMIVKVVGGAQVLDNSGFFNIGKRNALALRKIFWKNNVIVAGSDVGGTVNRTVSLHIGTGAILVKRPGREVFAL
ncbi:MAG: chemotaxis protein CheD [Desulfobulbaceae bacterium]|nr:chemotaxis protein CheD [Desulfobulbaceae bacterium]MCK5436501.1 chemotaxis protein CheD [Desulfobulbaceae bacterium]MCK5543649.1 chemotaxis protein CheD [Desulfobulbaceae bacterium]